MLGVFVTYKDGNEDLFEVNNYSDDDLKRAKEIVEEEFTSGRGAFLSFNNNTFIRLSEVRKVYFENKKEEK